MRKARHAQGQRCRGEYLGDVAYVAHHHVGVRRNGTGDARAEVGNRIARRVRVCRMEGEEAGNTEQDEA